MRRAFRVWAPHAASVDLVIDGKRSPMSPAAGDFYELEADTAAGTEYAFCVDGSEPRPDPRSPYQPHGVHGASSIVDHAAFEWTDDGWRPGPLGEAVVYELHVGTFSPGGDFAGVAERLEHLSALGVTAIEIMPVAEFPGDRGWGYDGVDLWAPHRSYGGPEGLKSLVDAAHARGLAVILDVVYNHLGPSGNYLGEFGPYFTDRYNTPWGDAVNLDDAYSDEVRRFFIANALMWLTDYHCDGLRLDAVHAFFDCSALHFLEELNAEVKALAARSGRELYVIAESDLNDPRLVTSTRDGGYGLDAQWSDDFHHALHALLTGDHSGYYSDFGSVADVATALNEAYVYAGKYSPYRRRKHGRSAAHLPGSRFFGYLQTHDQIGNRALGERSVALMPEGLLFVGAALVLTSPFVPMLFMGEEWGAATPWLYFTDHADAELGRAVSEGRRNELAAFGWPAELAPDPQAESTFLASVLRWDELGAQPHRRLLAWHRDLIALRRATPDLLDGRMDTLEVDFNDDERWLVMRRGSITVGCNFAAEPRCVPVASQRRGELLLTSTEPPGDAGDDVKLAPESVSIWRAT